jgi:hypothetical protein
LGIKWHWDIFKVNLLVFQEFKGNLVFLGGIFGGSPVEAYSNAREKPKTFLILRTPTPDTCTLFKDIIIKYG